MSFGGDKQPAPPESHNVANTQATYNLNAAKTQQGLNMFNQAGPYGALNYSADPNSPSGYAASVSLSPEQRELQQNIQRTLIGQSSNFSDMYSQQPNFADPNAITSQSLKWQQAYVNPIWQQKQSNLDAQLRNQGISPGSQAWDNAQNLLSRNQSDQTNQFLMQMQPIAFQEMMQNYGLPLQIANQLRGQLPGMPQFVNTPQEQVQAPNYAQAAQNQYQGEQAQYSADQAGQSALLGKGAGLALSLGLAPFTGGASLMMAPGILAGTGGGGGGSYAGGWGGGGMFGGGGGSGSAPYINQQGGFPPFMSY